MASIKTIKVSNVSLRATERDINEFFSFSGDIEYIEMQSDNEVSQVAYVTFKDSQGAETAILLSGATIVDLSVNISLAPDYKLPPAAFELPPAPATFVPPPAIQNKTPAGDSAARKAEDVVTGMLAKGFILGKDAVNKAKSFDEKHRLTSTASAKVASFDKKIGFTEKVSAGTTVVSGKVREVDQKFQVSEKTKSALAAAEQKVKVAKAAGDVGQKTKEKVGAAEEERKRKVVNDFAQLHLSDDPPKASEPNEQQKPSQPAPAQGLIL